MNVVIIGGGPSGMMAAIASAQYKNEVTILEKMPILRQEAINYWQR